MAQTIEECLDYLAAARESVEELSLAADREDQLKQDESRLKKALDTEKKQMADAVGSTVKNEETISIPAMTRKSIKHRIS